MSEDDRRDILRTLAESLARDLEDVECRDAIERRHRWRPPLKFVEMKRRSPFVLRLIDAIEKARGLGPARERTIISESELVEWAGDHHNQLGALARIANDEATEPRVQIAAMKEIRETKKDNRQADLEAFKMEIELLIRETQHEAAAQGLELTRAQIIKQLLPDIQCVDKDLMKRFELEMKLEEMRATRPEANSSLLLGPASE